MEHSTKTNTHETSPAFVILPEEIWIDIIAPYQIKGALRKTCRYFRKLASSTNEKILKHPALVLNQKALERFVLYHGALGNSTIVRHLLAKGANPNTCDDTDISLLHYAAENGYVDIVDMLLQHPALITTDIAKGEQSPFWRAAQCNQNAVIERILPICTINREGMLYCAVEKGLLNTVRTLLACNCNANSTSSHGYHSLTFAAQLGHIHIMKLLIASDALVNCHSKNDDRLTPLNSAAYSGYVVAVQLLIDHGADVNIKGGYGNLTSLHCASQQGHIQVIEVLLNNGAHVNARKDDGNTPLDLATKDNVKQLLIAHGGKTSTELKWAELKQSVSGIEPEKDNCVVQ